jgi:hypothetical protein
LAALSDTKPANSTNRKEQQGMGLLTLFGFAVFFIAGILVGVAVENNHQQQKRREESIRYWRWANNIDNIEQQMVKDGWQL